MKIAVLLFVLVYYGLILGLRSYLLYRRTGINPLKLHRLDALTAYNNTVISICTLLVPVIAFNFAFFESRYQYFVPIAYLQQAWIQICGMIAGFLGLAFSFVAQLQMGDSWRIARDEKEHTALITHGLYRYSRNPVYLGLGVAFLGFFLMVPSAVSLCFLLMMQISIAVKIRLEEAYLQSQHPETYGPYRARVRRWL